MIITGKKDRTIAGYDLATLKEIEAAFRRLKQVPENNISNKEISAIIAELTYQQDTLKECESVMKKGMGDKALKARIDSIKMTIAHLREELFLAKEKIQKQTLQDTARYFDHVFSIAKKQSQRKCNLNVNQFKDLKKEDLQLKQIMEYLLDEYQAYLSMLKKDESSYQMIGNKKFLTEEVKNRLRVVRLIMKDMKNVVQLMERFLENKNRDQKRIQKEAQDALSIKQLELLSELIACHDTKVNNVEVFLPVVTYLIVHFDFDVFYKVWPHLDFHNLDETEKLRCYRAIKKALLKKDRKRRETLGLETRDGHMEQILEQLNRSTRLRDTKKTPSYTKEEQSCFEIMRYLMTSEDNLIYIQKMVQRGSGFANARNFEGMHILNYVFNAMKTNTMLKLKNQTKDYLNPSFFVEVYMALYQSPLLELSDEERSMMETGLREFEADIIKSKYKAERKQEIVTLLDKMKAQEKATVEREEGSYSIPNLDFSYQNILLDPSRKDVTDEFTIVLADENTLYHNCAFSISEQSDEYRKYWLNIHVSDVCAYLDYEALDEEALKKKMFSDFSDPENPNLLIPLPIIKNYLSLEEGKKIPTVTYRFLINNKGKVEGFMTQRSITKVDQVLPYEALQERSVRVQDHMKPFVIVSSWLKKEQAQNKGREMDQYFRFIANDTIGHHFNQNQLPYVYKVCEDCSYEEVLHMVGSLNHLFMDLNDENYRAAIGAICEEKMHAYYSSRNFGHAALDQRYYSDLLNPLDSYIGILLQGIVKSSMQGRKEVLPDEETLQEVIANANILKKRHE